MHVVAFPLTPVSDVPAQFRDDKIEAGEIEADAALCILPQDNAYPLLFLWGENYGPYADIAMLEMAKDAIINRFRAS